MRTASGLEQPTLDTIAAAYSAVVIERQIQLEQLLGDGAWHLDLPHGVLSVGGYELAVAQLAHADTEGATWRWAWPAPGALGQHPDANRITPLVEIGQRFDVPELATPALRLSAVHDGGQGPGHTLAVAACGLLAAPGYFPAAYDGGTVWVLITDERLGRVEPDAATAPALLTAASSRFPHANRLTVETYLGVHGLPARDEGDQLAASIGDSWLLFSFDEVGRLREIRPTSPPTGLR